jgi:cell division protein FtsZ
VPTPPGAGQPEHAAAKFVELAPIADSLAPPPARHEHPRVEDIAPLVLRDEVVLTPAQPKQAAAFAPLPAPPPIAEESPIPMTPFIPPQAERPIRAARMPRVEDLPVPAQNQLRATRGEIDTSSHDHKRMTLLQRLATVGFGRKDEAGQPTGPAEKLPGMAGRPDAEGLNRPPMSPVHAEYTKRPMPQGYRPAQGTLDPHGRPPAPRNLEDEQLEIPAFLRRQNT